MRNSRLTSNRSGWNGRLGADVRILLAEDDTHVADPLVAWLGHHGHEVHHVRTAAALFEAPPADLVLLDLGLPDLDGVEVCRRLRQQSDVPIIVATARGDEIDRVLGLNAGADDYLVKPFGFRELLARMDAVLRRSDGRTAVAPTGHPMPEQRLQVDRRTRVATLDGQELHLTRKEFDLLAFLDDDFGAVRTREEILDAVWDTNWYGSTRTLDVHIAAIRTKLGDAAWIETVRGVGFRLAEPS